MSDRDRMILVVIQFRDFGQNVEDRRTVRVVRRGRWICVRGYTGLTFDGATLEMTEATRKRCAQRRYRLERIGE